MTQLDIERPVAAASDSEASRLAEAFRIFNRASEELAGAYSGLQAQVATLSAELAAANGALNRELREKAALTERLAMLLDALPAGVLVLDPEGLVAQCNPAAETLLGKPVQGASWEELVAKRLMPTEVAREWQVNDRRVALEVTHLDSAGGRIVLVNDVTEAHRRKTEAARKERLAAMGEMAASLAHQLRTPLAAALLYTANLEQPHMPERLRVECATKAVGRLKHLERLIQDVLLFVRGEVLGRESIPVAGLMSDLAQVAEPLAAGRGVHFSADDQTGGALLMGERKTLTGALVNLLENALQVVEEGGSVALWAKRAGNMLEFHVRDDGRGIDPTLAQRLFEPFFTTRSDGTGLGLAIALGVARAHGGGIEAHPAPGKGSEFVLRVPLKEPVGAP
ncbi:MAG: ATP-binding protein [Rhodocyclaceae bacterium]|nr:ATP-binding protein [Rhodocyclaceae bacterium]